MDGISSTFKPPKNLTFDRNVHANLDNFLRSFDVYLKATGLDSKSDETKIAIFLNIAGEEAQKKFQTFNLTEENRKKYNDVVKAFKDYCRPMRNETYDRYKFFTRVQQEGEYFDNFLTEVKMLASECNFGTLEDSMIRDKIVSGILDLKLQERLLQQANLTCQKAETMCRAAEISQIQVKEIRNDNEVNSLRLKRTAEKGGNKSISDKVSGSVYSCLKCGRKHSKMNCPAFGKMCNICSKPNHFAVGCKFRNNNKQQAQATDTNHNKIHTKQSKRLGSGPKVHAINNSDQCYDEIENIDDLPFIDTITLYNVDNCNSLKEMWTEQVKINDKNVTFKLDSGANCNCMSLKLYKSLGLDEKQITNKGLSIITYGNNKIKTLGSVNIKCIVKGAWYNIKFLLIDERSPPILGLNACVKLNLVKKVDTVSVSITSKEEFLKNKEIFEGTGKVPFKYKIVLKPDAKPYVSSCRRVPDAIKPALKNSLDDLVKRDIIMEVKEPTEWVNNIVIVEKPNKTIRICLDPLHLNQAICNDQFPIPTLDELSLKLKGKSIFTVLDLKEGFYHVPLDNDSIKYTTFITPFGKYCFKRLPFGLSVSPEVFQRINEKLFGDLDIGIYFDDFIIAASNEQEHDRILGEVINRAKKYGVKFNINKVQFKVNEVKYLGQIFSAEGVRPNPSYIEAILKLNEPTNKKELLSILGMINYLTKYIPMLSDFLLPLRNLIKNNTTWNWTNEHSIAFNKIKDLITKIPNLKIFDSNLKIEVQTDASQHGIGGCILQNGQPIAFCSRALTDTEIKYPQIDKELLSICFTLEKFHNIVYGRKILIKTDHRPLVSICNKDFYKVSSRLQRLKLRLLNYNFDIEYLPGKYMYIADLLSRNFIKTNNKNADLSVVIHSLDVELPISDNSLMELKNETKKDITLIQIKNFCNNGWPEKNKQFIDPELNSFYKIQNSLFVKNDLVFFNDRLVVPKSLRQLMLRKLHVAHLGIEKTKARARKIFYWPGMTLDIQKFISKCTTCLKFSKNNVKEPLIPHERPNIPFYKIAADIFTYGGIDYLVIVDYFSNWIEMVQLESKSALEIIGKLKLIFSVHGIPTIFMSDNNPFNSLEFKKFAKDWDFNLITSSPRYPKSNGLAERAVGICKNLLKKCQETNTDIYKALLEYRSTPLAGSQLSPSELLNNRLLRTTLPVSSKFITQKTNIDIEPLYNKRLNAKKYYDRNSKYRDNFEIGDSIIIQNETGRHWVPGVIINKGDGPRSYLVQDNFGRVLRRNSSFLRHSPNPIISQQSEYNFDNNETPVEPSPSIVNFENISNDSTHFESSNNICKQQPLPTNNSQNLVTTRSGRAVIKPIRYRE